MQQRLRIAAATRALGIGSFLSGRGACRDVGTGRVLRWLSRCP